MILYYLDPWNYDPYYYSYNGFASPFISLNFFYTMIILDGVVGPASTVWDISIVRILF